MKSIELNKAVKIQISKASKTAWYLWQREWAERNGGNISINITNVIDNLPDNFDKYRFVEIINYPKEAANKVIFVSGTGERLRDMRNPEIHACIIYFNNDASGYYIIWGGLNNDNFRPTSELISHIKIHLSKEQSGSNHIAVIHTHPIELICLSHYPKFANNEEAFTNACWRMLPEVRAFCPKGLGLIPYTLSGSKELADLTVESLMNRDVAIWSKHGAIATGKDAFEAFDYIDVANKGAKIYLKCLASGFEPIGMTNQEIDELVKEFKLYTI